MPITNDYWNDYWRRLREQYPTWPGAIDAVPFPDIMGQNPEATYGLWGRYQRDTAPFQNWLGRQYNRYQNQYQAANLVDPTLQWTDYLGGIDSGREFQLASPYERGERPGSFAGRARWVP